MKTYVILLRGINVGGNNKVPMTKLKTCLEELGFADGQTYIASGNVILKSKKSAKEVQTMLEKVLPQQFKLNGNLFRVLALTTKQLKTIIDNKPSRFGEQPGKYHSDVIFLIGMSSRQAIRAFSPREGVDTIWPGVGVIYSQRLSVKRTQSRLNRVMGTPEYKSMTIRNWNTSTKLLHMVEELKK
jgi:uncharacterized protein (DUF1697 family)